MDNLCKKCGNAINDSYKFCKFCGQPVNTMPPPYINNPVNIKSQSKVDISAYPSQIANNFAPLIVMSIVILLNTIFMPMFVVWGGLFPNDFLTNFTDVVSELLEGTDFTTWIEVFTWSAFIPAIALFISSLCNGRTMSVISSAAGIGLLVFNLLRLIAEQGFDSVFDFDYCNLSIGFWVALILFVICFFHATTIKKY